jgi:polyisoprenoid-binding protein YceI
LKASKAHDFKTINKLVDIEHLALENKKRLNPIKSKRYMDVKEYPFVYQV